MRLRSAQQPDYHNLANKFHRYVACMGKVNTGFFRKRATENTSFERWLVSHVLAKNKNGTNDVDTKFVQMDYDRRISKKNDDGNTDNLTHEKIGYPVDIFLKDSPVLKNFIGKMTNVKQLELNLDILRLSMSKSIGV